MNKKLKILIIGLIILLLLFSLYLMIYKYTTFPFDELWNYNNIYKMYNGYRIYESTNVIITPLFFYIGLIWMKIFGPSVISIKYLGTVIFFLMYLVIYKILKKLGVSKITIWTGISLMLIRSFQIISNSANYNFLSIVFFYLGFLIIISKDFKGKDYLLGSIYFLLFMSKQNMALYFIIATLIFDLYKRESIKTFIIKELKRIITFVLLTALFILIYYKNGLLLPFLNFAFGGMSNFGQSNLKFDADIIFPVTCLIAIALDICLLFFKNNIFYKQFDKEKREMIFGLFIYTIMSLLIVFPILNNAHFLMATPLVFVNLIYIFDNLLFKEFFDSEKAFDRSLLVILLIVFCILARILYAVYVEEADSTCYKSPNSVFNNLNFKPKSYEKVLKMPEYIKEQEAKGKKVVILSYNACLANIPLAINNGTLDLIFEGNLGREGSQGVINKIKTMRDTIFLIQTDEEDRFWQESTPIFDFIINNYTKTGEILDYSIYE